MKLLRTQIKSFANAWAFVMMLTLIVNSLVASPIPASRLPQSPWAPGIPGGIPDTSGWTVINVKTQYGAVGDGVADDSTAIQNAINDAILTFSPRVIYLPSGTYRLNTGLNIYGKDLGDSINRPYSVVIKGDGPTKTLIKGYTSGSVIIFNGSYDSKNMVIASGNTAGSTTITTGEDFPTWAPANGHIAVVARTNDISGITAPSYMIRTRSQIVKILSRNGRTITFTPALNDGFSGDTLMFGPNGPYHCAVESLSITRMNNNGGHNIAFGFADECWVRNVESNNASGWHIRIADSAFCEVRNCYIHDGWNGGGDTVYGVGLFQFSCNNAVENNIFFHTRHALILEYGGQNNVFGYNYSKDTINESQLNTDWIMGDMISHGGNPQWNLWEGNVAQRLSWDNVLGGSKYQTAFRNQVQRVCVMPSHTNILQAVEIERNSYYGNVLGNILLSSGQTVDMYTATASSTNGSVRRLGMDQDGDTNYAGLDTNVAATLFYHMNWDYVYGSSDASYTDSKAVDNNLPNSYYLSAKPSWWDTGAWPAIGPDLTNKAGANPAFRRWAAYVAGGSADLTLLFPTIQAPTVQAPSNATTSISVGP